MTDITNKQVEYRRLYNRVYYEQNREKLVAYQIAYRKAHPEKYEQIKLRSAIRLLQKYGYTVIDPNGKDAEL